MSKTIALSVMGKDRPGIVFAITAALYETGCNIEDSSMTQLRGEFAMILLLTLGKKTTQKQLTIAINRVAKNMRLAVYMKPLTTKEAAVGKRTGKPYIIAVYGADRPGIVASVTGFLASKKGNITDVQTQSSAKNTLYAMFLEVSLPGNIKATTIQHGLAQIAETLEVSITMNPADEATL